MTPDLRAALLWCEQLIAKAERQPDPVAAQQLAEFVTRGERLAAELAEARR